MKQDIAILTNNFLDPDDPSKTNIGGVETWLSEFSRLLIDMGYSPIIYQSSVSYFLLEQNGVKIIGTGQMDRYKFSKWSHKDIKKKQIKWIVYATSFVGEKYFIPNQIFIQHGIHWDYPNMRPNFFERIKWESIRKKLSQHDLKMCKNAKLTISVDTNFINYARIKLGKYLDQNRIRYVPNFAIAHDKIEWQKKWDSTENIDIIFARRFVGRRGVHHFATAIEGLIRDFSNINVLIAGKGPAENFLRNKFKSDKQVEIQEIPHEKIASKLNKSHIAVIPSIYSEGTSLSCLEAMASGCAVIATNVGGLGNIILPDFNGLLIKPTIKDIREAIIHLIHNLTYAEELANNGFETVTHAFSLTNWKKRIYESLIKSGIRDFSNRQIPS